MHSGISIAKRSFLRNKIYLFNHLINNISGFIFGYIFYCIWSSILAGSPERQTMITYVLVNQASLFLVMFLPYGCMLPEKIRDGSIAFYKLRPQSIMYLSFFEILGHVTYSFIFRCIPLYLSAIFILKASLPKVQYIIPYFVCLFLGFLISFLLNYFVGLWTLKFLNHRAAQGIYFMFMNLFGGILLPATYFPGVLSKIVAKSPFACTIYIPGSVYLGKIDFLSAISVQIFWVVVLYLIAKWLTNILSKNIVVQGG